MKIKEVIELLCRHELTKDEAIHQLEEIMQKQRPSGAIEMTVYEYGSCGIGDHDAFYIYLKQYATGDEYSKLFRNNDRVYLIPQP